MHPAQNSPNYLSAPDTSAQPCGCDRGANYTCNRHYKDMLAQINEAERMTEDLCPRETKPASIPTDAAERKGLPLVTGVLDYFPLALLEVAKVSKAGNDQHNPGKPLHWDRAKSRDEADALGRHLLERGKFDTDGQRHSAKLAWRALALLQKELEGEKV